MQRPEFVTPEFIDLKKHPVLNEKWLHERLTDQPELLQLDGDLYVKDSERSQPSGGRLDLLLADRESDTRYEVEVQLGATDPSHIIRTIEYWDVERRRFPQYDHIAVIVAEDITSRFLNVISLFNRAIAMIAIQIKLVEVNGALTLVATRVLDLVQLGTDDDDETEKADRRYWEQRASRESLGVVDATLDRVKEVESGAGLNYNLRHIGILIDGRSRNFVAFHPKKGRFANAFFKMKQDENVNTKLDEAGLVNAYRRGTYRVRWTKSAIGEHEELLRELIQSAHSEYFGR